MIYRTVKNHFTLILNELIGQIFSYMAEVISNFYYVFAYKAEVYDCS